jgi:hypothetical protein
MPYSVQSPSRECVTLGFGGRDMLPRQRAYPPPDLTDPMEAPDERAVMGMLHLDGVHLPG